MTRFIFVTGGVLSSLGKGLASAALAALLQARGYRVRIRKFDPYLNVDPGTMSPQQHGEVYVTDDGAETDLDLGHYERFTGVACSASDNVTTGRIYSRIIQKERNGDYLGATVQVIPHVTDEIKRYIEADLADDLDFLICEVGGTVGDIEGLPYLEAIRQFINEKGRDQAIYVHLTLVPYIASADEIKTKPSQHSVKELLHVGIQPDILLCRCDRPIPEETRKKIALFCNLRPECVIEAPDVSSIYQVPVIYSEKGLDVQILKYFSLPTQDRPDLTAWQKIIHHVENPTQETTIAVVAKYTYLRDAYKSLTESLVHGGIAQKAKVHIKWIKAEDLEKDSPDGKIGISLDEVEKVLGKVDGILVPGGHGVRGTVGKITAIEYARTRQIPYLGICFGMQLAVIEAARHLAGLPEASSTEFGPTCEPIVGLLTEWTKGDLVEHRDSQAPLGGTMRLGAYDCHLTPGSLADKIYQGEPIIFERHRHRYEVNIAYKQALEQAGFFISGLSKNGQLPTIMERRDHPWFFCVQFHPEFKSYPFQPSPIFSAFIQACLAHTHTGDQ